MLPTEKNQPIHTEQAFQNGEEGYRALFQASPYPTWVCDRETLRFLAVNEAALEHYGFTHDEFLAMTIEDIRPPEDIAVLHQWLPEMQRRNGVNGIWRHCKKDGAVIHVRIAAHDLQFSGRAARLIIAIDITEHVHTEASLAETEQALRRSRDELELRVAERTAELAAVNDRLERELEERRRTEAALETAQRRLQLIMDNLPEAIMWKDRNSVYLGSNMIKSQEAGLPSVNDIIGKTDFEMPWAEYAPLYVRDDALVMETDTPKLNFEEPFINSAGERGWLRTSKIPLHDGDGTVTGVLVTCANITEQKEAQAALVRAKEVADDANRAKSEFLSRMSHELRTPLNAILGFAQLLDRQDLPIPNKDRVSHILRAGRHLLDLINEVLDIARIESGHLGLSIEPVPVARVLQEACEMMRPLAAEYDVALEIDNEPASEFWLLADYQRLKQVLINLLANAVKYNRRGGRAVVSFETREANRGRVSVSDTGAGIAAKDLAKLFIPFERLGAANSGIEGTGLGLALSYRLIEGMHGAIDVESTPGQGSTFFIELPLAAAPAVSHTAAPLQENGPALPHQYTVLCIEDNISNFKLIRAILEERPGARLLSAMQGLLGLELARQHHPDIILLDLHLPDIMGWDVLARLREMPETRAIPVVIVSADATSGQIDRLLNPAPGHPRADAYLTKPLNLPDFLRVFDEFVGERDGK